MTAIYSPFYRWGNQGTERSGKALKVTQLVPAEPGFQWSKPEAQIVNCSPCLSVLPLCEDRGGNSEPWGLTQSHDSPCKKG